MIGFNGKSWKIGIWFGIPVYVDVAFIVLVAMCMLSTGSLLWGLVFAVLVGFSIVAHEFGHSLTVRCFGFSTYKITLSALGGCAMMRGIPKVPWQEMLVAVAGPLVSLVLGVIGLSLSSFIELDVIARFGYLNTGLAIFNLLPGFPMDGGRVLRAGLSWTLKNRSKATWWAMMVGRGMAILLGALGVISILAGIFNGLMMLLIAWFIWKAGEQEYVASLYGH